MLDEEEFYKDIAFRVEHDNTAQGFIKSHMSEPKEQIGGGKMQAQSNDMATIYVTMDVLRKRHGEYIPQSAVWNVSVILVTANHLDPALVMSDFYAPARNCHIPHHEYLIVVKKLDRLAECYIGE